MIDVGGRGGRELAATLFLCPIVALLYDWDEEYARKVSEVEG